MLKKFTVPVTLLLVLFLVAAWSFVEKGSNNVRKLNDRSHKLEVKEDGKSNNIPVHSSGNQHENFGGDNPPTDAIPGLSNFNDYATNGNSTQRILVSGNTVVVITQYLDSAEIPNANGGTTLKMIYNYSTDGGNTWELTDGLPLTSDRKSRYPDCSFVTYNSNQTIVGMGRFFGTPITSTTRFGGITRELELGAGAPDVAILPYTGITPSSDAFGHVRSDGKVGMVVETNGTDSLVYSTYDPATGTTSGRVPVFNFNPALGNTVAGYTLGASTSGSHMTAAIVYINEPGNGGDALRSVRYFTSTDNGTSWSSAQKILGNGIINGDSVQPYWHMDVAYKPNTTTPYIVFSATDYTTETNPFITRKSHKIVVWSPSLNSGNPVVVADWNNMQILADTSLYNRVRLLHVNSVYLSHPSIGFSSDGNVIGCVFSAVQPDTNQNSFTYEDCYFTYSTDAGATWSTPSNYTNTVRASEKYPVIAETGNGSSPYVFHTTLQYDTIPGCMVFTDLTGQCRVFEVYKRLTPPIGIININGQVPQTYSLQQNYPNPFNPTTKIRFAVPNSGHVSMKLYNILGKEVKTLVSQNVDAGNYEYELNASNLASGVYFYVLEAGNFKDAKKMILVK